MTRVEHIGAATLYLGRCEDILPTLERIDAIISDPPYGQNHKTNVIEGGDADTVRALQPGQRYATAGRRRGRCKVKTATVWPPSIIGDDKEFDPAHLLKAAKIVTLWGAHKFGHLLPRGRWLGWDKVPTGKVRDQGDGELAWTNVEPEAPLRFYRLLWDGVCVDSRARHEVTAGNPRVHPTQKPESLMAWTIAQSKVPAASVICDPYMGSGSTGIAALRAECRFVGVEAESLYFETACRRIEDAQRQGNLFGAAA